MGWVPAALRQQVEVGLGLPTPATRILQKGATGVLGSPLAVRIQAASPSLLTRVLLCAGHCDRLQGTNVIKILSCLCLHRTRGADKQTHQNHMLT